METKFLEVVERELHDLSQPLTVLQCRLELAQMYDDIASLREAVSSGLEDTARLFKGIAGMRGRLHDLVPASTKTSEEECLDGR